MLSKSDFIVDSGGPGESQRLDKRLGRYYLNVRGGEGAIVEARGDLIQIIEPGRHPIPRIPGGEPRVCVFTTNEIPFDVTVGKQSRPLYPPFVGDYPVTLHLHGRIRISSSLFDQQRRDRRSRDRGTQSINSGSLEEATYKLADRMEEVVEEVCKNAFLWTQLYDLPRLARRVADALQYTSPQSKWSGVRFFDVTELQVREGPALQAALSPFATLPSYPMFAKFHGALESALSWFRQTREGPQFVLDPGEVAILHPKSGVPIRLDPGGYLVDVDEKSRLHEMSPKNSQVAGFENSTLMLILSLEAQPGLPMNLAFDRPFYIENSLTGESVTQRIEMAVKPVYQLEPDYALTTLTMEKLDVDISEEARKAINAAAERACHRAFYTTLRHHPSHLAHSITQEVKAPSTGALRLPDHLRITGLEIISTKVPLSPNPEQGYKSDESERFIEYRGALDTAPFVRSDPDGNLDLVVGREQILIPKVPEHEAVHYTPDRYAVGPSGYRGLQHNSDQVILASTAVKTLQKADFSTPWNFRLPDWRMEQRTISLPLRVVCQIKERPRPGEISWNGINEIEELVWGDIRSACIDVSKDLPASALRGDLAPVLENIRAWINDPRKSSKPVALDVIRIVPGGNLAFEEELPIPVQEERQLIRTGSLAAFLQFADLGQGKEKAFFLRDTQVAVLASRFGERMVLPRSSQTPLSELEGQGFTLDSTVYLFDVSPMTLEEQEYEFQQWFAPLLGTSRYFGDNKATLSITYRYTTDEARLRQLVDNRDIQPQAEGLQRQISSIVEQAVHGIRRNQEVTAALLQGDTLTIKREIDASLSNDPDLRLLGLAVEVKVTSVQPSPTFLGILDDLFEPIRERYHQVQRALAKQHVAAILPPLDVRTMYDNDPDHVLQVLLEAMEVLQQEAAGTKDKEGAREAVIGLFGQILFSQEEPRLLSPSSDAPPAIQEAQNQGPREDYAPPAGPEEIARESGFARSPQPLPGQEVPPPISAPEAREDQETAPESTMPNSEEELKSAADSHQTDSSEEHADPPSRPESRKASATEVSDGSADESRPSIPTSRLDRELQELRHNKVGVHQSSPRDLLLTFNVKGQGAARLSVKVYPADYEEEGPSFRRLEIQSVDGIWQLPDRIPQELVNVPRTISLMDLVRRTRSALQGSD